MRARLGMLALAVAVTVGCEYNLGPSITNTNTNTNTIDIHDLINFAPVPNPTAPVPAPDPPGGMETPLPLPANAQNIAATIAAGQVAALANSCQATSGESAWAFMDAIVTGLRASDPRWGYLPKSSGGVSQDVIAYRATSDSTGAWGVDIIVGHCGAVPSFGWQVLGFDPNARWTGSRF